MSLGTLLRCPVGEADVIRAEPPGGGCGGTGPRGRVSEVTGGARCARHEGRTAAAFGRFPGCGPAQCARVCAWVSLCARGRRTPQSRRLSVEL